MSSPYFTPADGLIPVAPVRPVAGYIGGKRNLARCLVQRIAATPHTAYAEPFVGMGGIFFRRTVRPKVEVINDWSADVANLFRVLQRHYVAFIDMIRFEVTTRAGFDRLMRVDPGTQTDLERAARFLYLQRLAFGGKVVGRGFGVAPQNAARFDVSKLGPMLEAVHERLSGVVIERLPWSEFIARYDRPATLFYLDPPYYGSERDYGDDAGRPLFTRDEFEAMAAQLATLRGGFILSLNDHPDVRRIFAGFAIDQVETSYTIGGNAAPKRVRELIISG